MDLAPFGGLIVAAIIGVVLAVTAAVWAKRAGLAPYQATLIETLQDNVAALTTRVAQLERENEMKDALLEDEQVARVKLQRQFDEMRATVNDLAAENTVLRRRLGMDPR